MALVSLYEQGHQPLGLASPAAALRAAGYEVTCLDASVDPVSPSAFSDVDLVGISVPMHTAARLGLALAQRLRTARPGLPIIFYGLYAPIVRELALTRGLAEATVGGEYEPLLVSLAADIEHGRPLPGAVDGFARQAHPVPDRSGLPALERYARVRADGELRLTGYVEASRGCAHSCTHCPITPVYGGRLRLIAVETVLADVDRQVALGARHITFGDPDFLNAAPHSLAIVDALRARHPGLTFDVTVKVEHLIEHESVLPRLREAGCLFVTSAFESTDDDLLRRLQKGHTRADLDRVLAFARSQGLVIRPTWMAFTPWTTAAAYLDLLAFVAEHDLIDEVQPVQYGLRLLLPPGSPLVPVLRDDGLLGSYDADGLSYSWTNLDDRLDRLQAEVAAVTAESAGHDCDAGGDATAMFTRVRAAAWRTLAGTEPPPLPPRERRVVPGLTENWFC